MQFDEWPEVVPDTVITNIKESAAAYEAVVTRGFECGDGVRIVSGPLAGYEGVFERYCSGQERAAVLLAVLGTASRTVTMARMCVEAIMGDGAR